MRFTLLNQTREKFYCTCNQCKKEDVSLDISYVTKSNEWGHADTFTKVGFNCPDCGNKWSELH